MEEQLKGILWTGYVPTDLVITYDDWHGLWGGSTLTVRGTGEATRQAQKMGAPAPTLAQAQVSAEAMLALITLLVQLQAWQQQTPERPPVPDESRASLTIRLWGETSYVWEWLNDLASNGRLIKVKEKMDELTTVT